MPFIEVLSETKEKCFVNLQHIIYIASNIVKGTIINLTTNKRIITESDYSTVKKKIKEADNAKDKAIL